MTGFWNYILLTELAHKLLSIEGVWASNDPARNLRFKSLENVYMSHEIDSEGDLSQRLLREVNKLTERFSDAEESQTRDKITEWLYAGDIRTLVWCPRNKWSFGFLLSGSRSGTTRLDLLQSLAASSELGLD